VVSVPSSGRSNHQLIVGRLFRRFDAHVRRRKAGRVVASPVDVILDQERALVVQPDVAFISSARLGICTDQIWGAPDLVVEVLSTSNRRHDRPVKVGWYAQYGVRECWLVDPVAGTIEVVDFSEPSSVPRLFDRTDVIKSRVLPDLQMTPVGVFTD
jgi:Uma2 family endonuclease